MYQVLSWDSRSYAAVEESMFDTGAVYELSADEVDGILQSPALDVRAVCREGSCTQGTSSALSSDCDGVSVRTEPLYPHNEDEEEEEDEEDDLSSGHGTPCDRPRPCLHNQWDNLRAKRETVALRCRICQSQWKTYTLRESKCPDFSNNNCPRGDECTKVHVFRFKLSSKKRKAGKNKGKVLEK